MGMREFLNEHRTVVTVVIGIAIVACLFWITWQSKGPSDTVVEQLYFTDDDGKSFFADDALRIAPYDRGGKTAVKAYVYDCGGTRTVHYMERYTEAGQKAAAESLKLTNGREITIPDSVANATEYKRPGEADWKPEPPGPLPCPDGKTLTWVTP